jgi:hypothetical protein
MSEHAFEDRIEPKPKSTNPDIEYLFSGLNPNPLPNQVPNQVPGPGPNPVPNQVPNPNPVRNPSPISYSQVLEQMDDIIRITVISANLVFDEELFAPLEKMREKVHPNQLAPSVERITNKEFYERSKKYAKSTYDDAIIKILKKCADDYKYKDYFKVDQSIPIIEFLEFTISMFKDDYNFLKSYCISNNALGKTTDHGTPVHRNFSQFLSNILNCSFSHPEINTIRRIGGDPPLKRDITNLKNISQDVCYKIIMEIFEVIQLFVDERGNTTTIGNSGGMYILPFTSYAGKFNIGFMISFLQCFVDFFKNMNRLNYAFHIRSQESSSASSNKGGTRRRKQKYIKNKKGKRKTSRK